MQKTRTFTIEHAPRLEPMLKARESLPPEGESLGIVYPPVSLASILDLTYSNAFHTQCLSLKADMSVGLDYEAPKEVETFLEGVSGDVPFLELLHQATFDWECMGNGYLEVARSRKGSVGELYHAHAQTIYPRACGNRLQGYIQEVQSLVDFAPWGARDGRNELFQLKRYTPLSTWYGLPEWIAALEALRLDQEKKTFYASFFRNFAVPSLAVVLTGAEFDEATEKKIEGGFKALKGAENSHKTLLLSVPFEDAKITFEKLTADLKDLPFEKLSQSSREEILAAHGVPPRLVGIVTAGALGGGSEMEGQMLSFVEMKVKPRMRYLENRVKLLLRDAGLPPEFALKGITPTLKEYEGASPEETAAAEEAAAQEVLKALRARGGF